MSKVLSKLLSRNVEIDDGWELVLYLLTDDEDHFPRVCLLSKVELDMPGDAILNCVVRSAHTSSNLQRLGKATLVVAFEASVFYLKMEVSKILVAEDGLLVVSFAVLAEKKDSFDVPIRPMQFLASAGVREIENWEETRLLLDQLSSRGS